MLDTLCAICHAESVKEALRPDAAFWVVLLGGTMAGDVGTGGPIMAQEGESLVKGWWYVA